MVDAILAHGGRITGDEVAVLSALFLPAAALIVYVFVRAARRSGTVTPSPKVKEDKAAGKER